MEIITLIEISIKIVGAAVVLLGVISPFTRATWDDKLLIALKNVVSNVKVNKEDNTVLIQVPKK